MLADKLSARFAPRAAVCLLALAAVGRAEELSTNVPTAAELTSIGGRWYVRASQEPDGANTYYYLDGDRHVDLFSYHTADTNDDGVANLEVSHDENFLIVDSQNYPNHPTAIFPNSQNPNTIRAQNFRFRLPLVPRRAATITRLPMGPVGMAINGVVFFNPFEIGGMNAVEGYSEIWLDACCGHPQQEGVYHYHKYPSCVKSPFKDDGHAHSPIIGFAWDGYPVHGPYEADGLMAKNLGGDAALDVCNGHEDSERGYHYHVTPGRFPYITGGYAGVVETSNNHELRFAGRGAIENNARGESREGAAITSVRPGTVKRGGTRTITIDLRPAAARGLPQGKPSWAQIGPFEANRIERAGDRVTIDIEVGEAAAAGVLLDCHLEFESRGFGSIVIKKNDVLRVVE